MRSQMASGSVLPVCRLLFRRLRRKTVLSYSHRELSVKRVDVLSLEPFNFPSLPVGNFNRLPCGGGLYLVNARLASSCSTPLLGAMVNSSALSRYRQDFRCAQQLLTQIERRLSNESNSSPNSEKEASSAEDDRQRAQNVQKLKRNTYLGAALMLLSMTASLSILLIMYGAPREDEDGNPIDDEFSGDILPLQYLRRAYNEFRMYVSVIQEPSREKLLPDPLKEPYYQPKYTVVLEMSGVLVHPEWQLSTGWRFKKRPALDFFISQVGYPNFELVIYTQESGFTAFPIINSMDPNGLIMYRLFKDATLYRNGKHIKDLSKLNRDLSKVILVDWDPGAMSLQPENALRLPKWVGDDTDTGLVELAALLKTIGSSNTEDVRPVVQYYSSFEQPLQVFRDNQNKLKAETEVKTKDEEQSLTKSYTGRLFGFRRHV